MACGEATCHRAASREASSRSVCVVCAHVGKGRGRDEPSGRREERQQREQQQGQQQELERTEAESSAAAVVTLAQHTFDSALAGAIAGAQGKKTGF